MADEDPGNSCAVEAIKAFVAQVGISLVVPEPIMKEIRAGGFTQRDQIEVLTSGLESSGHEACNIPLGDHDVSVPVKLKLLREAMEKGSIAGNTKIMVVQRLKYPGLGVKITDHVVIVSSVSDHEVTYTDQYGSHTVEIGAFLDTAIDSFYLS